MNTTSVAAFSQNINNGKTKSLQPINPENRLDLRQLVGLDPMSTVYRAVEIAFEADRALVENEITKERRDLIKEALVKLVDNTKGNPWFPW